MRRRLSTLPARLALAAALLLAIGGAGSLVAGDLGAADAGREYRSAGDLAALLADGGGRLVVDAEGRPLVGKDGKPLRVASDGRTLLDSSGKPLKGKGGRTLKLTGDGAIPDEATGERRRDRRRGGGRGNGKAKKPVRNRPAVATKAPIVVGIAYNDAERLNEIYARYGGNARASDGGSDAKAVADHINATGGIGGRPLELRLREYDTTDGRPYDVTFAEVCQTFAEGKKPLAVITIANDDELAPCLADKGIPLINDWPMAGSTAFQQRFASMFFQPGSLALDRFSIPYIRGLQEQSFFGSGTRVGLLRYSDSVTDEVSERSLKPALAAAGIKLTAEEAVPVTRDVNDIGGLLARIGSAIVRFRAAGVNRVISIDNTGQLVGLFAQAASPQGYNPRYGLSSLNSPLLMRASLPPDAFRGSVGIGWSPITDVAAAQEGDVPATRSRCKEIFDRAGLQQLGDRSAYGQYGAYSRCSNLLMLRPALERADGSRPAALRAAIEALGAKHQSAVAMQTELNGGRHDGVTAYRFIAFDDGCACFEYRGGLRGF